MKQPLSPSTIGTQSRVAYFLTVKAVVRKFGKSLQLPFYDLLLGNAPRPPVSDTPEDPHAGGTWCQGGGYHDGQAGWHSMCVGAGGRGIIVPPSPCDVR